MGILLRTLKVWSWEWVCQFNSPLSLKRSVSWTLLSSAALQTGNPPLNPQLCWAGSELHRAYQRQPRPREALRVGEGRPRRNSPRKSLANILVRWELSEVAAWGTQRHNPFSRAFPTDLGTWEAMSFGRDVSFCRICIALPPWKTQTLGVGREASWGCLL